MDKVLIALAVLGIIVLIWVIQTGNRFRRMNVKIDESESGIDVALTKRYDTLTKMLDVTRGFAAHEVSTFERVIHLRQGMSMVERNEANAAMDRMADRLNVLVENYPELKSSDVFINLQGSISDAEAHLQAARRLYNANVSSFNQLLVSFPSSIIGNAQHQVAREFFEAEDHKRADVAMTF